MKRLTMQIKLLPLVAVAILLLNGCSIIGFTVGSGMEPKTYQRYEIARVARGQTVIIPLKDGTVVRGTFTRLAYNPEGAPLVILHPADTDVLIALDDIRRIHKPGKKNAKLVGLLIGASLDVAAILLMGSLYEGSPGGFEWFQWE